MQDIKKLMMELKKLKKMKKRIEEEEKLINARISDIEEEIIIYGIFNGIKQTKITGIGTCSYGYEDIPRVTNQKVFFTYLDNQNKSELAKRTINHNTLRGWWNKLPVETKPVANEIGLGLFSLPKVYFRNEKEG